MSPCSPIMRWNLGSNPGSNPETLSTSRRLGERKKCGRRPLRLVRAYFPTRSHSRPISLANLPNPNAPAATSSPACTRCNNSDRQSREKFEPGAPFLGFFARSGLLRGWACSTPCHSHRVWSARDGACRNLLPCREYRGRAALQRRVRPLIFTRALAPIDHNRPSDDFCEPTVNFPCGNPVHHPRTKPVIAEDTTYGVSLLTGTISGSKFANP
jgi:hypothetical protein